MIKMRLEGYPLTKMVRCGNVSEKEHKMPRVNVYLSEEIKERLAEYRHRVWGNHHSLSAIVQRAIREFIDREAAKVDEPGGKSLAADGGRE